MLRGWGFHKKVKVYKFTHPHLLHHLVFGHYTQINQEQHADSKFAFFSFFSIFNWFFLKHFPWIYDEAFWERITTLTDFYTTHLYIHTHICTLTHTHTHTHPNMQYWGGGRFQDEGLKWFWFFFWSGEGESKCFIYPKILHF